ncbi:MAG: peptidoglycan-binding domain-containing protein [Bryobacteraceae bacterium]
MASTAKGKKGTRRVARKPAGPSYQLHPDPQRYAEIQHALSERGYFHGEANGEWQDDSVDALKRFQADQKLPDDGRISALTLSGLGLGPHHDGSTAATVPLPTAPASEPPVSGSTVGPASAPAAPSGPASMPVSPNQPPRE